MFICQDCSKVSKPFDKPKMFTTKTRQKAYTKPDGKPVLTAKKTPAVGWEIVEEIKVCKECYDSRTIQKDA
jgi:hypothetical protein